MSGAGSDEGDAQGSLSPIGHGGVVVGVLGPTGVGKTMVAATLAGRLGGRVISCDSMQVYRDFPVLTNQPSAEEMRLAPHEMVGVVDGTQVFSAVEYAEQALPLIDEDLALRGAAVVVGGTGLYMRAALAPLDVKPAPDEELRSALEGRAAAAGAAALHDDLARLDPPAAAAIDPRNVRRVIRALEIVMKTGARWSGRDDLWSPQYRRPTLLTALMVEREELYRRIDLRARQIVEGGAVEEVARFRERVSGGSGDLSVSGGASAAGRRHRGIEAAIGFAEICDYLDGRQTLEVTVERVAAATRRYARRQTTWLRKVKGLVIIDIQGRTAGDIADEILAMLSSFDLTKEPEHP